jgi:hypothetical protein
MTKPQEQLDREAAESCAKEEFAHYGLKSEEFAQASERCIHFFLKGLSHERAQKETSGGAVGSEEFPPRVTIELGVNGLLSPEITSYVFRPFPSGSYVYISLAEHEAALKAPGKDAEAAAEDRAYAYGGKGSAFFNAVYSTYLAADARVRAELLPKLEELDAWKNATNKGEIFRIAVLKKKLTAAE